MPKTLQDGGGIDAKVHQTGDLVDAHITEACHSSLARLRCAEQRARLEVPLERVFEHRSALSLVHLAERL